MLILFYDPMLGRIPSPATRVEISTDRARFDEADAVVFHIPEWPLERVVARTEWDWQLLPRKRRGQLWVAFSVECDVHYPLLRNARFMRHFDLTLTYRLTSDLPVTYVIPGRMAEAFRRPAGSKNEPALIAAFVSSTTDKSGREDYLRELARHMAIDFYGRFMRNRSLPGDAGPASKLAAIANYRFTVAFENARGADYVTEKFFEPLQAGSVPVYLGAPNVEDFAPGDHCFINAADYSEPAELAARLRTLAADEAAYRAYFAWKDKPFRAGFERLLALEAEPWFLRLCQALGSLSTAK